MAYLCNLPQLRFASFQGVFNRLSLLLPRRSSEQEAPTSTSNLDRRDFNKIQSIPDSAFVQLMLDIFDPKGRLPPGACRVIDHDTGSNNYCVTLKYNNEDYFVVRVPAWGTKAAWTEEDAFNLRSEVKTMEFIRENARLPIPFVQEWDTGFDNPLGAPYVLMDCVKGLSACWNLWYGSNMDGSPGLDVKSADNPDPALERKRQHFLRSLANVMVKLNKVQFNEMGMLHFEDREQAGEEESDDDYESPAPTVGHWFKHVRGEGMQKREAYSSTAEYFETIKDEISMENFSHYQDVHERELRRGYARVVTLVCDAFPRSVNVSYDKYESESETFVLAHDDLDLQNIYVDRQGNIVGIIDWSGVRTKPRWAGWSALPVFLRKDWQPDYDVNTTGHWPWKLKKYRQDYELYLKQALASTSSPEGEEDDTKFTPISDATWAALEMLEFPAWRVPVIDQLLRHIPPLRDADHEQFLLWLGGEERWKDGEAILKNHLPNLFM